MRRFLGALLLTGAVCAASSVYAAESKKFDVYTDKVSSSNHYAPSGWMGDVNDLSLDDESMSDPYAGATCIKISYSGKKSGNQGWAGVYWQNPPNNWGNRKGGFDLSGFNKLVFRARGETGKEVISKVKIGGIGIGADVAYPDSAEKEDGPVKLTKDWKEYSINLSGVDLSYINGGLSVIFQADQNPQGAVIYLDDVYYTFDASLQPESDKVAFPFYVYADKSSLDNHYVPSGYMGDFGDVKLEEASKDKPHSGSTCIKVGYTAKGTQGARWTGVFWQNPANNWGTKDGGINLTGATKLVFMARGAKGGERIEEFKVGGIMGEYSDSDTASIGPVVLTNEWKEYSIDLRGKDLSYLIGGFCWVANADGNPEGAEFYLDDIRFDAK